jgi:hypothetical protein
MRKGRIAKPQHLIEIAESFSQRRQIESHFRILCGGRTRLAS